ncbi:MAG: TnpV protein [Clostridia bacterium]|nr:TnpV protein [Clostridia bacterium]
MKKTDEIKNIGKWGRLHYDYLYNNKRTVINAMRIKGTLNAYLQDFNRDVDETFDRLVKQTAKAENVTEQLKSTNQIEWLRRMNNIRNRAEEFVLNEFVYQ